jgi:hypothetical protein
MIAKIIISIFLISSISFADSIEKDSPFSYRPVDTSSITQEKLESIYFADYKNGISILPSILKNIQNRDGLNTNQLFLECNDTLFESMFKGTIVEEINKRNGVSRFISDCRKIVLHKTFKQVE